MKKVLVVEDEVVVAVAVRLTLESSGYETTLAADGLEGLARAEADPPDVILTDRAFRARERANLMNALERADGRIYGQGGAAELLGINPTTLASRLRALKITPAKRR